MPGGRGRFRAPRVLSEAGARASRIIRALKKVDAATRPGVERELSILFSDIVGSTGYFERHGDSAGLRMVRRHHELCKPIVEAHGGRVVKTIGDGLMAVFDSPRGAVDAAHEMQRCLRTANSHLARRERIRVRIGVHHGPVLVDSTGDVFGDVVNVAARIQAKAGPEQILVGEPIQRQLADAYPLRSVGNFQLKGKTSRIELYEVPWKPPEARRPFFQRWGFLAGVVAAGCLAVVGGRYWQHHHRKLERVLHTERILHPAPRTAVSAPPPVHEQPRPEEPRPDRAQPERPKPVAKGRLTLVTIPKAELWLGQRRIGRTPVATLELPAGVHHLILVGPSHKARVLTVTVKPGQAVKMKLRLKNLPRARKNGRASGSAARHQRK